MFCAHCGNQLLVEAVVCPRCGCATGKGKKASFCRPVTTEKTKTEPFCFVGFVAAFFPRFCLLGIIFSIVGLMRIKKTEEKGKGLAIAGIIVSTIYVVTLVLFYIYIVYFSGSKGGNEFISLLL